MTRPLAALALICALLTGCATTVTTQTTQTREERVKNHFAGLGTAVGEKESLAATPAVGYLMVDEDRSGNGIIRSLWATTAGSYASRCFYLDEELPDGNASGFGGCGGGAGTEQVTLSGNAESLIGDVGTWTATQARLSTNGQEVVVPVREHYFLVPSKLSRAAASGTYRVVLLDDVQKVVIEVTELRLAGS